MNYEDLYQALQPQEKSVKDSLAALQKLYKAISKETESGDLKGLAKDLAAMSEAAAALSSSLEGTRETVDSFDTEAYFKNGDFAEQMLEACQEAGVDVRGESPVYEMFPYRVKLDMENQDLYMDRKKVQCMRPKTFVQTVKAGQEKLNRASFNAQGFLNELADAYDLAVLKQKKQPDSDVYLSSLYKFLAPMSRYRKDYDQQSYAFDLARLYAANGAEEVTETKNGRKFQFGPPRMGKQSTRILDANGQEQYLSTIRFYTE